MPFLPEFNGFSYLELNGLQTFVPDLQKVLRSVLPIAKPWRFYLEGLELLELLLPAMMCQGAWCCSGLGEHCRLAS